MKIGKKRIIGFAFFALLICAVAYMSFLLSCNGCEIGNAAFQLLKLTHRYNPELDISDVYVDGEKASRCSSEDWWLASVKDNQDHRITMDTGNNHRYAAVLKSDIGSESIEADESVYIIVYTLKGYNIYRLRFTTLPVMHLDTGGTPTLEGNVLAFFEGSTGKVHLRGRSTRVFNKKSYRLSLDDKVSFIGMRKDDDWILYSGFNDPERIRNVFSSNLWFDSCAGNNQFKVPNGYEYRFVELFVNGDYAGFYALGYKPDQKQFKIGKGEYLFSKTEWEADGWEIHGSRTKENEAAAWEALSSDFSYDESSEIDLWLFTNFCAAADNAGKNYYLALKKTDDGLTAVCCPWDLDLSWGSSYSSNLTFNYSLTYSVPPDTPMEMAEGGVFKVFESGSGPEKAELAERLKARYEELRNGAWSDELIDAKIKEYESAIFCSGAYRRDVSRWADSSQQDPELKLSRFREFVRARIEWMDGYIAALPDSLQ